MSDLQAAVYDHRGTFLGNHGEDAVSDGYPDYVQITDGETVITDFPITSMEVKATDRITLIGFDHFIEALPDDLTERDCQVIKETMTFMDSMIHRS